MFIGGTTVVQSDIGSGHVCALWAIVPIRDQEVNRMMRKTTGNWVTVEQLLLRAGKQVFKTAKRLYYVDYNGNPCKMRRY